MGTNVYATFSSNRAWPEALPVDERVHLFKTTAAGGGRLRVYWARNPVPVVAALSLPYACEALEEEDLVEVLQDLLRADTIHDFSQLGREFS